MAKVRFTEEQIADFLQQSKNGVPNNVLCENLDSARARFDAGKNYTPNGYAVS
jgi:hypothetical protein